MKIEAEWEKKKRKSDPLWDYTVVNINFWTLSIIEIHLWCQMYLVHKHRVWKFILQLEGREKKINKT